MDYITKKELYDVIGKPLPGSTKTIFFITIAIILLLSIVAFLIIAGYIQVSDPVSNGVRQTTGTA